MRNATRKNLQTALLIVGLAMLTAGLALKAHAGTPGEFDGVSPDVHAWFARQVNAKGEVCCDDTEAVHVEDWRRTTAGYEVTIDGKVLKVPPQSVSPGVNIMNVPFAWIYPRGAEVSEQTIRCFKPGLEG